MRNQIHLLIYLLIHAIFSLYKRIRQAYHSVADRIYSVLYYHHRTPELIERDVRGLRRLPKHLSVILELENGGPGGAELERLVNEAADISAWCASAGIPQLSIYEKTGKPPALRPTICTPFFSFLCDISPADQTSGILKAYFPETQRAINQKLAAYFGPKYPSFSLHAPHTPSIETLSPRMSHSALPEESRHLSVMLLSVEDGRDSIVDLTKTLTEMAQRSKISPSDISLDLVDAELIESVMTEPDLLILFSSHIELSGYPPWQIRLTEIFHVQDNQGVGYQVFYRGLCNYAKAQMRLGR